MKYINGLLFAAVAFFSINSALAVGNLNKYENQMIDKVWITTGAVDAANQAVAPSDQRVNSFFGIAQYNADGTFKLYTPEGKEKLAGNWSISQDGKTRQLVAKKPDGSIMFTRTVDNITVEPNVYTYRVYPDADNKKVYFDIIHQPLSVLLSQSN